MIFGANGDSRSGYLPAEHIETPTERLARLNKHRNIDVRRKKVACEALVLTRCSCPRPCSVTSRTKPETRSGSP